MSRRAASLRRRLMLAFGSFTLLVAGMFGLYAVVFMYAVEDSFLEATLAQEGAALQRQHATTGTWGQPREPWIRLHDSAAAFPDDLRRAHASEPDREEFAGEAGRHYHLLALRGTDGTAQAWLVAEVSAQLVVRPMRDDILALLAVTALVLVLLALGVAAWLAHRTAGPLARLAGEMERLDPGDPPRGLDRGFRHDEVGVLAHGLQSLADRLREFVAREREFTRDVSHELRTPLAVIRSASERLLARTDLDADARASAQHLQQSAMQLQQTVDLLLSLAREERIVPSAPVRVLPVLERVIVDQSPLAEGRAMELQVEVADADTTDLPEAVLRSLLSNLVGNALVHGAEGIVHITSGNGDLCIANPVAGDAVLGHRREDSPGFGLGLGIVRRLCERHGIVLDVREVDGQVRARFPLPPRRLGCRTAERRARTALTLP
ncbi:sensor histidine kinase [Arenimonas daejeonensis]|uniref:sensor histidine kinase n=1 Tax=Arenimonas daejeonensis TaxID=370777 RepID=UPI0011BF5DE6|nr:HAMP domain-containing sensor histidine kinase [Arenimonas daejeonensis]